MQPLFHTDFRYTDRATKGRYVWEKYQSILGGASILDVGADKGALGRYLPAACSYSTLGYGEAISLAYNLEQTPYPFQDCSFDVVLCLDVLEHLENIHTVFDECCRIAEKYIIISLPNPYADFIRFLYTGKYMGRMKDMKFYGLTPEPEQDRHRWFFSPTDAKEFIECRSRKNKFSVAHYDQYGDLVINEMQRQQLSAIFRRDLPFNDLCAGTMWWVCKKEARAAGKFHEQY
jgi:hypothetical protein